MSEILESNVDITERKRIEEALRESESRERERAEELATVLDSAPLPVIIVHDPEGSHMTGNRASDNLLRIPSGTEVSLSAPYETKPHHFKAVKDGRELSTDELPAQRAARGFQVQDFEFSLVFDDGTKREVVGYGTPLWDEEGQPRGAVHVLVDITERKQKENTSKAVNSINQIIHSTLDFDEIMQKTVSEAARAVGCESAAISLREGNRWIVRYVYGFPDDVIGTEMDDAEEQHAVLAIKTKKPVAINDAFNDERVNRNHMKKWSIRSVLVVPLITRDEVIGCSFSTITSLLLHLMISTILILQTGLHHRYRWLWKTLAFSKILKQNSPSASRRK